MVWPCWNMLEVGVVMGIVMGMCIIMDMITGIIIDMDMEWTTYMGDHGLGHAEHIHDHGNDHDHDHHGKIDDTDPLSASTILRHSSCDTR